MERPTFVDLPYEKRRVLFVVDQEPRPIAEGEPTLKDHAIYWSHVVLGGPVGGSPSGDRVVGLAKKLQGQPVPVSWDTARQLRFPPGHPTRDVAYIGHPLDVGSYIPAADFHRSLFEHKVAEALRLVRSLGASSVTVLHIKGWDREAAAHIGLNVPLVAGTSIQAGAEASPTDAAGHQILTTMKLEPTGTPHVPDGLVWISHEPLWVEVAAARLESGLKHFTLDVRTFDDFGVNTRLKALISKRGLEAGGKFVEHQDTVWRLEGTFS